VRGFGGGGHRKALERYKADGEDVALVLADQ